MPPPDHSDPPDAPVLKVRLVIGGVMLGPGKADLLQSIGETGSIAAAGRRMNMSYKRAWMLVEQMNAAFAAPLVDSTRGGMRGGGARLTETGQEVLDRYRRLVADAEAAGADEIAALRAMLGDIPGGK